MKPIEFLGSFESTYQPAHDIDVSETTGHAARWKEDLDLLRSCGVTSLRYPVRWHRIETEEGNYDWKLTDQVLGYMRDTGMRPYVDLLHHTSYPRWLTAGFDDARFHRSYVDFVEAFACRFPDVTGYTLFNEPFTTFLLCGKEAIWPPYLRTLHGFLRLATNVFPAVAEASRMCHELMPDARHLYVDTCERHNAGTRWARRFTAQMNDRRFFLLDLFLGRDLDRRRPFVSEVNEIGADELLAMEPGRIDILGLDYYAHSQWQWDSPDRGVQTSPNPAPLADVIEEYWKRYQVPCMLGETNIRGFASDRASWLKYTLEQCERARARGVPLEGYCWFPFIDSCDWDSLLFRADGHVDPVGVYWLDEELRRRPSSMSASFRQAVAGEPAAGLPAFTFQPPVSDWMQGWLPHMSHWEWQEPPEAEVRPAGHSMRDIEMRIVPRNE
ncbi:MAG: family 1 glycosylhydrolase [Acidimicrobiales bacterium]